MRANWLLVASLLGLGIGPADAVSPYIAPLGILQTSSDACFYSQDDPRGAVTITDVYLNDGNHFKPLKHRAISAVMPSSASQCLTYERLFGSSMFEDLGIAEPYSIEIVTGDPGYVQTYRGEFCILVNENGGFTVRTPSIFVCSGT